MRRARNVQSKRSGSYGRVMAVLASLCLTISAGAVQSQEKAPTKSAQGRAARTQSGAARKPAPAKSQTEPDPGGLQESLKNPEFMAAVDRLQQRLVDEAQLPPPRSHSRILARLPESTLFYGAVPNFGPMMQQFLGIFHEELRGSPALRDFLQKNKLDANEPKFEDRMQKFCDFMQFLGDEFVITGGLKGREPSGVVIAEVKKPGLKAFLEKINLDLNGASSEYLRIVDPQQLETATDQPGQQPVVLVRPDFVVIGLTAATVREFNVQLDKGGTAFTSNPLGKRLAQAYQSGTETLFGADLQRLIDLNSPQSMAALEKFGFANVQYAVMDNKLSGKNVSSQIELVFNGPRHGVASWIASPGPLGALDFISPKATIAQVFRLKNPAQIFDDIVEMAGPRAFASLPQMEQQLNVNLKQDLLSKLGGELALELHLPQMEQGSSGMVTPRGGDFKVVLSVSDVAGLQQTLKTLLATAPVQSGERTEDGVTFYTLTPPSAPDAIAPTEFNYFFMDGYLVIASNRALAREAARAHRNGESLGRSSEVAGTQGQTARASMMMYQNTGAFLATVMSQLPPDMRQFFPKMLGEGSAKPNVVFVYGDANSLRATINNSMAGNAGVGLIIAAIAIPNLMRSRVSANEAAAAASLRTINISEVTYSTMYPEKGYAPALATMGQVAGDCSASDVSPAHACLLDHNIGNAACTVGKWCEHSGYRFSVRGVCRQSICTGYVATATPVSESTGTKSFCSTADAVVRTHTGPSLTTPLTEAECEAWQPLM
jgi:hypothetical protein